MGYNIYPSLQHLSYCYKMSINGLNAGTPFSSSWWQALTSNKDPLAYILAVRMYPVEITTTNSTAVTSIIAGPHQIQNISAYYTDSSWMSSASTITVPAHTEFFDVEPYSSAQLYLPFIGFIPIMLKEIRGTTLSIHYAVDWSTGDMTAYVYSGSRLIKTAPGSMGWTIPLTADDNMRYIQSIASTAVSAAGSIAMAAATGGASAALTAAGAGITALTAKTLIGSKGDEARGTVSAGWSASNSPLMPILYITSPIHETRTATYKHSFGIPVYTTFSVALLIGTGYTEIESIHCEGITMTDTEQAELEGLLKSGVIF